jgi:hypothetical protein
MARINSGSSVRIMLGPILTGEPVPEVSCQIFVQHGLNFEYTILSEQRFRNLMEISSVSRSE